MLAHTSGLRANFMLAILGFLGATVLSFRFNMFILLPAILLGWTLVLVDGLVNGNSGALIALQMAAAAVVLQLGYLAGIVMKWALLASRASSWSEKPAAVPADRLF
jgi:hypothetical protein